MSLYLVLKRLLETSNQYSEVYRTGDNFYTPDERATEVDDVCSCGRQRARFEPKHFVDSMMLPEPFRTIICTQ
jgi:hypothetical protein